MKQVISVILFMVLFMTEASGQDAQGFMKIKKKYLHRLDYDKVKVQELHLDLVGRVTNMLMVIQVSNKGAASINYRVESWTFENGDKTTVADLVGEKELWQAIWDRLIDVQDEKGPFYEDRSGWDIDAAEFRLDGKILYAYFPPNTIAPSYKGVISVKLELEVRQ